MPVIKLYYISYLIYYWDNINHELLMKKTFSISFVVDVKSCASKLNPNAVNANMGRFCDMPSSLKICMNKTKQGKRK